MPIYEYQCTSCGKRLEMIKKISDPPETFCPDCQQDTLQKLVSAAGFRLKGTGWYVTDFKNKSDAKPTAANDKDKSKSSSDTSATPAGDAAAKEATTTKPAAESKPAATSTSASTGTEKKSE